MRHMSMIKSLFAALAAIAFLVIAPFAAAQGMSEPLDPSQAFALEVEAQPDGALRVNWEIADGYYLYRDRFEAKTAEGDAVPIDMERGEVIDDPYFGEVEIFHARAEALLPASSGPITLSWQGCQEDGICYAPQTQTIDADGGWQAASVVNPPAAATSLFQTKTAQTLSTPAASSPLASSPPISSSPTSSQGIQLADEPGILQGLSQRGGGALVILGFLGFGLLLAFTPCVLPMVPIVAGMLSRQGETLTARKGMALTGVYVLAMATVFGLLGVVAAWSGQNLQVALQSPVAIWIVAALFVVLAMSMFGLFELQIPQGLAARLGQAEGRRGSLGGAALLGVTSALIVGPCVTAPLAGALLYIAQTGDVALGAAALFALGLGQGLPLMAVGAFGAKVLPRAGLWMDRVKQVFGVVFLGLAIWLAGRVLPGEMTLALWAMLLIVSGVLLGALDRLPSTSGAGRRIASALGIMLLFAGLIQGVGSALGAGDPLRPLAPLLSGRSAPQDSARFASVTTGADLDSALSSADGRGSLVYVTADWCVSCRAIERGALSDPEVQGALANLHLIEVDVSDFNDESQAMLDSLGSAGPPTMVFLDATQSEAKGTRLIGNINSTQMLASIRAVAR